MDINSNEVCIEELDWWSRQNGIEGGLFDGIFGFLKGAGLLYLGNPVGGFGAMIDGIQKTFSSLISRKHDHVNHRAYILVYFSIRCSLVRFVDCNKGEIQTYYKSNSSSVDFDRLSKQLDDQFKSTMLKIDQHFLRYPEKSTVFILAKTQLKLWLQGLGVPEPSAQEWAVEFKSFFVNELNSLQKKEKEYFDLIAQTLSELAPWERVSGRTNYDKFLIEKYQEKIFGENFGLDKIYLSLAARYEASYIPENKQFEVTKVYIVKAEEHLMKEIQNEKGGDRLFIIRGGPGSGKSSLLKRLAYRMVLESEAWVYFISLQGLKDYRNFTEMITSYIKGNRYLTADEQPLAKFPDERPNEVIYILDGLDELSRSYPNGLEAASRLIDEICHYLNSSSGVKVIVTGRDLVVQKVSQNIKMSHSSVLEILPLGCGPRGLLWDEIMNEYNTFDPQKLLQANQRDEFWKKYDFLKNTEQAQDKVPAFLSDPSYSEISRHPVILLLLAKSYFEGKLKDISVNGVNGVYFSLVKSIWERKWEDQTLVKGKKIELKDFFGTYEELAISGWHLGDVSSTNKEAFRSHCEKNGLKSYLTMFNIDDNEDSTNIVLSFLIKPRRSNSDKSYSLISFTHKSFGEYFTACGIMRRIERVVENKASSSNVSCDPIKSLIECIRYELIDEQIYQYLKNEASRTLSIDPESAKAGMEIFHEKQMQIWESGLEFTSDKRISSKEVFRQVRNVEVNLLIIESLFSVFSNETKQQWWGKATNFYRILLWQRETNFNFMKISMCAKQIPKNIDLSEVEMSDGIFRYTGFDGAKLGQREIKNADFSFAKFENVDFTKLIFSDLNFESVEIGLGCDLKGCSIINLTSARIRVYGKWFTGEDVYAALIVLGVTALNKSFSVGKLSEMEAELRNLAIP